ncbi:MAG: sigma-70 family RNA polymerase sigma factor [Candidatus Polarisedimenticolia bacterium]
MAVNELISNEALVERMAQEDQEALSMLYDRHRGVVFALALRILRDRAEAEEVLSDVFFQAWRSASGFDPLRGSVTAWLVTLCRSRAIDRLRRQTARRVEVLADPPAVAEQASASLRDAEAAADLGLHRRLVVSALGTLSQEQRGALELAYFDGYSHSEIAGKLGQPLGTVKTRIRQGLLQLRKSLGEQFS